MSVVSLTKKDTNVYICPECKGDLEYSSGEAMQVVNGKVDYESIKPRYICHTCNKYYRELLNSGFYDVFQLLESVKPKKKVINTGDLPPMKLSRDKDGYCKCPRCGENMKYLEGEAVRIVDGKPDFSNTMPHFQCASCSSVYRKIASTDYFQWNEK